MPTGDNPNSRANLRPIPPELRKVNARKGTGHKAKIRLYMQGKTSGVFNGETVTLTEEEWIIIEAVRGAKSGNFRARDFLFNRLYGKPVQPIAASISGSVDLSVSGKRADQHSKEEREYIRLHIDDYDQLPDGRIIKKSDYAEFTDLDGDTQHSESGDSEP